MAAKKVKPRRKKALLGAGVLAAEDILSRLKRPVSDVFSIVITPIPNGDAKQLVDADSVDLSLGSYFFVPRGNRTPCFLPGLTDHRFLYVEEYVPVGSYLVLPAHHTVLGATLEYIKLPADVSGEVLTKSSWARTFITIETAPWIHPLYRGCLTLEIANVSNTPVILYPGVKIAQIVFLKTSARMVDPVDKMDGTYIGPVRPEPSLLKAPDQALGNWGVDPSELQYPFDEFRKRAEATRLPEELKK